MAGSHVGVAQGNTTRNFNVIDHRGLGADPFNVCTSETPDFGAPVAFTSVAGKVAMVSADMPATAQYAGFCDPKVIADFTGLAIFVHGELAAQDTVSQAGDKVGIWRVGRYRVSLVDGVVGDNVKVYPAALGKLSASATGSAPFFGIARKGNAGVAGGEIEVEIDLA